MTEWLKLCGLGMAYRDPAWPQCGLAGEARSGLVTEAPCGLAGETPCGLAGEASLDLDELPELLRQWHADGTAPPLRRVPRYARMGLLAALRALRAAHWHKDAHQAHERNGGTALVIGSAWGSVEMSMDFMDSLLEQGPRLSSPTAFSHAVNNMGAGLLSLLLQTRGACQTVSQFELSFAGALQAASLELASGRAQRVLVGALEETDPRFARSCPEAASLQPFAHEGAVFLCLEQAPEAGQDRGEHGAAHLRLRWQDQEESLPLRDKTALLLSGAARHEQGVRLEHHYGRGPLGQALDLCVALQGVTAAPAWTFVCRCRDHACGRNVDLEVRYSDAILGA